MPPAARNMGIVTIALVMMLSSAQVLAAEPLGFYIGAGVGHSQVRNELDFGEFGVGLAGPYSVSGGATGWKLMAGIRPLSFVGAELAYIDFGSVNRAASTPVIPDRGSISAMTTSHPKAAALFAVGYLPIPLRYLDVFAKAGVAQLKSDVKATGQKTCGFIYPPCGTVPVPPYSASRSSTRLAYGVGAQLKFTNLAVRAEYERVSASSGDVDLLSVGVAYGF